MLIKGSRATVADNSGGLECEIFCIYGGSRKRIARVGDIVKVAIKAAIPNAKIKKGDVSKAIIIRTKYCVATFDGHRAYAGQNAVALLTENLQPVGTRIFGFASRKAFYGKVDTISKMASFCEEVY
jgi:large subunit ribosomal protein L14